MDLLLQRHECTTKSSSTYLLRRLRKQSQTLASPQHSADASGKAKELLQIYIPWNKHEPQPGSYDWAENLAVTEFVELADKLGLWVILRAGPYICAEWDGGGIPWWLASSKVSHLLPAFPALWQAANSAWVGAC